MAADTTRGRVGTVRVRTTLAATAVVGIAMTVAAVVLVIVLRDRLTSEVRAAARLRAQDVVDEVESAGVPERVLAEQDDRDDAMVQILDPAGRVVVASANVEGFPAVARLRPGQSRTVDVPFDDDRFLAVAEVANSTEGRLTVLVARTTETVGESTRTVTVLLALGVPVLLLVMAGTTWKVVGRALAPVDAIRREVDTISAAELHRRVPEPEARDEIGLLARTMNRMLGRLERAHLRQRRFVADASHELRSPIASIRQHAEVALAHPDRASTRELAETVLAEGLRVQQLVEDLLLLAEADEHTVDVDRRPLDVDDLVFEEARRLRDTTDLRIDTTAVSAGRVHGDAAGLRRVLRNLGDNAARHARSRIAFSLAQRNGKVVVDVDDDGPGIPDAERERVLERFVRLDDARARDGGGSGLGLAIVSEVVVAHGGQVRVSSSPLGGTRIELELPA